MKQKLPITPPFTTSMSIVKVGVNAYFESTVITFFFTLLSRSLLLRCCFLTYREGGLIAKNIFIFLLRHGFLLEKCENVPFLGSTYCNEKGRRY